MGNVTPGTVHGHTWLSSHKIHHFICRRFTTPLLLMPVGVDPIKVDSVKSEVHYPIEVAFGRSVDYSLPLGIPIVHPVIPTPVGVDLVEPSG